MKKHHIIAAVITLASGMSAFGQDTAAPSLSKLEALAKQITPPAVHDAAGFQADGAVRPIFFDALDWEGKPTRVFAWIGLPAGTSKEKPVPGIVLVHGGGGSAFKAPAELASLALGKAAMRSLVFTLAQEGKPLGIHVGTVTVCGPVRPGTPLAPEYIAEKFWELYTQKNSDSWTTEVIME